MEQAMLKLLAVLAITAAFSLAGANAADARLFEPQPHWLTAGADCIAARNPPARRWQALPPRACVAEAQAAADNGVVASSLYVKARWFPQSHRGKPGLAQKPRGSAKRFSLTPRPSRRKDARFTDVIAHAGEQRGKPRHGGAVAEKPAFGR
jgi:hypothetical protein